MGTTYRVNEFDEVVPYYDGRASNSTTDRREVTEFEGQLLVEIKELKTELANQLESQVDVKIAGMLVKSEKDEDVKIEQLKTDLAGKLIEEYRYGFSCYRQALIELRNYLSNFSD